MANNFNLKNLSDKDLNAIKIKEDGSYDLSGVSNKGLYDLEGKTDEYYGSAIKDTANTLKKGVAGVVGSVTGLSDVATGGLTRGLTNKVNDWSDEIQQSKSPYLRDLEKQRSKNIDDSESFLGGIGSAVYDTVSNPRLLLGTVGEMLPNTVGGAIGAKGIQAGAKALGNKFLQGSNSAIGASSALLAGGGNVSQVVDENNANGKETTFGDKLPALASGAVSGFITGSTSRLAEKYGLFDSNRLFGFGAARALQDSANKGGFLSKALLGTGLEGLQEGAESGVEQVGVNYGTGNEWDRGLNEAVGVGLAGGLIMGAGGSGAHAVSSVADPNRQSDQTVIERTNNIIDNAEKDASVNSGIANFDELVKMRENAYNQGVDHNSLEEYNKLEQSAVADFNNKVTEAINNLKTNFSYDNKNDEDLSTSLINELSDEAAKHSPELEVDTLSKLTYAKEETRIAKLGGETNATVEAYRNASNELNTRSKKALTPQAKRVFTEKAEELNNKADVLNDAVSLNTANKLSEKLVQHVKEVDFKDLTPDTAKEVKDSAIEVVKSYKKQLDNLKNGVSAKFKSKIIDIDKTDKHIKAIDRAFQKHVTEYNEELNKAKEQLKKKEEAKAAKEAELKAKQQAKAAKPVKQVAKPAKATKTTTKTTPIEVKVDSKSSKKAEVLKKAREAKAAKKAAEQEVENKKIENAKKAKEAKAAKNKNIEEIKNIVEENNKQYQVEKQEAISQEELDKDAQTIIDNVKENEAILLKNKKEEENKVLLNKVLLNEAKSKGHTYLHSVLTNKDAAAKVIENLNNSTNKNEKTKKRKEIDKSVYANLKELKDEKNDKKSDIIIKKINKMISVIPDLNIDSFNEYDNTVISKTMFNNHFFSLMTKKDSKSSPNSSIVFDIDYIKKLIKAGFSENQIATSMIYIANMHELAMNIDSLEKSITSAFLEDLKISKDIIQSKFNDMRSIIGYNIDSLIKYAEYLDKDVDDLAVLMNYKNAEHMVSNMSRYSDRVDPKEQKKIEVIKDSVALLKDQKELDDLFEDAPKQEAPKRKPNRLSTSQSKTNEKDTGSRLLKLKATRFFNEHRANFIIGLMEGKKVILHDKYVERGFYAEPIAYFEDGVIHVFLSNKDGTVNSMEAVQAAIYHELFHNARDLMHKDPMAKKMFEKLDEDYENASKGMGSEIDRKAYKKVLEIQKQALKNGEGFNLELMKDEFAAYKMEYSLRKSINDSDLKVFVKMFISALKRAFNKLLGKDVNSVITDDAMLEVAKNLMNNPNPNSGKRLSVGDNHVENLYEMINKEDSNAVDKNKKYISDADNYSAFLYLLDSNGLIEMRKDEEAYNNSDVTIQEEYKAFANTGDIVFYDGEKVNKINFVDMAKQILNKKDEINLFPFNYPPYHSYLMNDDKLLETLNKVITDKDKEELSSLFDDKPVEQTKKKARLSLGDKNISDLGEDYSANKLQNKNLGSVNFSESYIFNKDFSGSNLSKSYFIQTESKDSNFSNTDLTNTNFQEAFLRGLNFTNANLTGAKIDWASLIRCNFTNTNLSNTSFNGADFLRSNLTNANLEGIIFNDKTSFKEVVIDDDNLLYLLENKANLEGELKERALALKEKRSLNSLFDDKPVEQTKKKARLSVKEAEDDLLNNDYRGADLSARDFSELNLTGIDLSNADLHGIDFTNSNLSNANLSNTDLSYSLFRETNFDGVNFTDSNLENVETDGYEISGSFKKAIFKHANIRKTFFNNTDFIGTDFRDASISDSWFFRSDFTEANMSNLDLRGLEFKGCIFDNTNLRKSDMSMSNLKNTGFYETNLSNANLSRSIAEHIRMQKSNLSKANLSGANFSSSRIEKTNLTKADLSKADFSYADLIETDLTGANLEGANFDKTDFIDIIIDDDNLLYLLENNYLEGDLKEKAIALKEKRSLSSLFDDKPVEQTTKKRTRLSVIDNVKTAGIEALANIKEVSGNGKFNRISKINYFVAMRDAIRDFAESHPWAARAFSYGQDMMSMQSNLYGKASKIGSTMFSGSSEFFKSLAIASQHIPPLEYKLRKIVSAMEKAYSTVTRTPYEDVVSKVATHEDMRSVELLVNAVEEGNAFNIDWKMEDAQRYVSKNGGAWSDRVWKAYQEVREISAHNLRSEEISMMANALAPLKSKLDLSEYLKLGDTATALSKTLQEIDRIYDEQLKEVKGDDNRTKKIMDARNSLVVSIKEMHITHQKLIDRGYVPMVRFGDYGFYAKVNEDNDPNKQYYARFQFESPAKAKREYEKYKAEGKLLDPSRLKGLGLKAEADGIIRLAADPHYSPEVLSLDILDNIAGKAELSQADIINIRNEVMKLTLARDNTKLREALKRKAVWGYDRNLSRVLASWTVNVANASAKRVYMPMIKNEIEQINEIHSGDIRGFMDKWLQYINDPREELAPLRALMSVFMLSSPASSFLNVMMNPVNLVPYLYKFGGLVDSVKIYKDSLILAGKDFDSLDARTQKYLEAAALTGRLDAVESATLLIQARGSSASSIVGNELAKAFMSMFSKTEQYNRRTAAIAAGMAYDRLTEQQKKQFAKERACEDNLEHFIRETIDSTQMLMNKGNRAVMARGSVGSLAYTFKPFAIGTISLFNYLRGDYKGKGFSKQQMLMLGLMIAFSGVGGLPFEDDLIDIIESIAARTGNPIQIKKEASELASQYLSESAVNFLSRGIGQYFGVDTSSRTSFGNIIPGTKLFDPYEKDRVFTAMKELFGPIVTLSQNMLVDAPDAVMRGDFRTAFEKVSPALTSNFSKGMRALENGGFTDQYGRFTGEADVYQSILKAIGFSSEEMGQTFTLKSQARKQQQIITGLQKMYSNELYRAIKAGDYEKRLEIYEEMKEHNMNHKDYPINIKSVTTSAANDLKSGGITNAIDNAKLAPKAFFSEYLKQFKKIQDDNE